MKKLTRSVLLGFVLVVTFGLVFSGCSKNTDTETTTNTNEARTIQSTEATNVPSTEQPTKATQSTNASQLPKVTNTAKAVITSNTAQPSKVQNAAQDAKVSSTAQATKAQKTFTSDELKKYNGENGNKAYVAINGKVYDVTNVGSWKNGMHKGYSAGNDLSSVITESPHGEKVLENLPLVGVLAK
jgi:predicted heme/steroid binding protein